MQSHVLGFYRFVYKSNNEIISSSDNEKQVLNILDVHLNSENLGSQTEDPSELTEGQMAGGISESSVCSVILA